MILKKWDKLPDNLKQDEIRPYYDALRKKGFSLFFKRVFDVVVSFILLVILSPLFLILAVAIKIDSKGPIFYRQTRVTQYGKTFRIFKFRTMVSGADKKGAQLTSKNDSRITRVGKFIRKCRLDEVSQLIDVFRGTMTFVGTRPEVPKYVDAYSAEMLATLLLPAGVTSEAAIYFKDEDEILGSAGENVDEIYVNEVLPRKMYYNLRSLTKTSVIYDIGVMFKTVFAVLGKKYTDKTAPAENDVADNDKAEE
jgi:lipopolysaccharide/colanic/teichoic acid biosynthesis glycosyltransferase